MYLSSYQRSPSNPLHNQPGIENHPPLFDFSDGQLTFHLHYCLPLLFLDIFRNYVVFFSINLMSEIYKPFHLEFLADFFFRQVHILRYVLEILKNKSLVSFYLTSPGSLVKNNWFAEVQIKSINSSLILFLNPYMRCIFFY